MFNLIVNLVRLGQQYRPFRTHGHAGAMQQQRMVIGQPINVRLAYVGLVVGRVLVGAYHRQTPCSMIQTKSEDIGPKQIRKT
jgi:hypothetical protein